MKLSGDIKKPDFSHPLSIKIRKAIARASEDFSLIEPGDRLMVCVSGGKDSSILLALLKDIQARSPFKFYFEAVLLDQKQPGFNALDFKNWVEALEIPLRILEKDTYSIVKEKVEEGKIYCSLCSKLRRAILYKHAEVHGFNKLVLGHHKDDLMETFLLNLFYTGKTATMAPKLRSDDGSNLVIRPMIYVEESDLIQLSEAWAFPIIPCNLCGSQDGLKRKRVKRLLADLRKEIPHLGDSMLAAMGNIHSSHLLDRTLWDFQKLKSERQVSSLVYSGEPLAKINESPHAGGDEWFLN